MDAKPFAHLPSQAHADLLRLFLTHREAIVDSIEAVLNARRKPASYLQDLPLLSRHFEDCFFAHPGLTAAQTRLKGQLEAAHAAAGFKPRQVHHVHNDLIHPAEMMLRGFHFWQRTQWPGHSGRLHYAHTLFNLFVVRSLEFLSMRIWDEDDEHHGSAARLAEIQALLNELWRSSPSDQPVIVRDARWLIPLAQSLITDELAPYLEVSRKVADTLPESDRLEIRKAHVRMLGGHLTSQIRYYCAKDGISIDEPGVVGRTRTSNALDFALLVDGLVELLKAYDRALRNGDERMRFDTAGAICQGISADPELFLHRIDLLSPYTMMEHVFIAGNRYSLLGERHLALLKEYAVLIDRLTPSLREDAPRFKPLPGGCSPYGIVCGIPSGLIELMVLKTLQRDAETRFSLEDVFDDNDTGAAKLAWVDGWRKLPHIDPEVQRLYSYPQQFAEDICNRIARELNRAPGPATGRLYIDEPPAEIPELPPRYFLSSDNRAQLQRDRQEAHFLVTWDTPGGWIALRKELLTEVLGAGRDARIAGLPPAAAKVLRLMCPDLVGRIP